MNKSPLTRNSRFLLVLPAVFVLAGCAGSAPKADSPPSHLFQLTDEYWLDPTDIREIQFQRNDVANAPGIDPFYINLYRNSSENAFVFGFADQPSAYAAWKRLVAHLGGSLHDDRWSKPTAAAKPAVENAPPTPQSQNLFQQPTVDISPSYATLKKSLAELANCRDEKLITEAEFQHGRDAATANFSAQVAEGSGYQGNLLGVHSELAQLEMMKKDHLLSDEQIAAMRKRIIARYGLTDQNQ